MNDLWLNYYFRESEIILKLALIKRGRMKIFIPLSGKTITLNVDASDSIKIIKDKIE